jgi:hypothetical protein
MPCAPGKLREQPGRRGPDRTTFSAREEMNRCVVIHRTGISEVQDVQPEVHRHLRGLSYRRFVVEFVREADGRGMTSALYAQAVPSTWQIADAVKKLWGRGAGATRVFDENGHLLDGDAEPAPQRASSPPIPGAAAGGAKPEPAGGPGHRVEVGSADPVVVEALFAPAGFPKVRLTASPARGWVVEVSGPAGEGEWREVHVIAPQGR